MAFKCNDGFNEARYKLRQKRKTPLLDIMPEEELCYWFGCSAMTLQNYRNKEGLPYIKVGKDVYYSEDQVYLWMLSRQVTIAHGEDGNTAELPVVFKKEKSKPKKIKKSKRTVKTKNGQVSTKNNGISTKNKDNSTKVAK